MKIGLVTITELDNFGNRLQNYALQSVLQELGHTAETIPNLVVYKRRKNLFYKFMLALYGVFKWFVIKNRDVISSLLKQARFEKFDSEYICFSSKYSTIDYIPEDLDKDYDAFIAGSDQIWNSNFLFNFEFNFLRFAQENKRISYSASFGTDSIKAEYVDKFTQYLSEMAFISVREIAGKKIVENLTDKTATVVLDPTMLIDTSKWSAMERKPKWDISEKFILTYYLGGTQGRKAIFEQLYNEHKEYESYQVIDIGDPNMIKQYAITPDEFLWLVHHSSLMITDSFHGTVFSVLFGTPFCFSPRIDCGASMQSRLDSLFEILDINNNGLITDVKKQKNVYLRLEEYRGISMAYLKDALSNVENVIRNDYQTGAEQ